MTDSTLLSIAGWTLASARGTAPAGAGGAEAILTAGSDRLEPPPGVRRGILGAVARDEGASGAAAAPGQAARLALGGLIEGFFSARPTLGQGRAANEALNAINSWMFATHGTEGLEPGLAASLSAVIFSGVRVGLVQIGSGMILRLRAGDLIGLAGPHLRRVGGSLQPRRGLGADSRLLLDYAEDTAQAGDRYILLSDARDGGGAGGILARHALARLCRAHAEAVPLAEALAATMAGGGIALVIDVRDIPEHAAVPTEIERTDLPLGAIPQEGDNRDGYLIGRTIHRGAYTLLKRAIDTRAVEKASEGRLVVLKFPLPAMLNDRVFQAGFAREAWIASAIHSPFIGRVITPEPGRQSSLYVIMPYYRGETLEARIEREPRFQGPEIVAIGLQLCQAVEDLRAVQILHRDLKPDNIMLQAGGGLRLLDLGLAYLGQLDLSEGNGPGGTLRYMAPEQIRGSPANDTTEVFALGMILHRLAALGRFPRLGPDVAAALERQRPDLPASLRQTIQSALSTDPDKRPRNAGLLAEALTRALHDGGAVGRRSRDGARRRPEPLIVWRAAAVILGLALAGLSAYVFR